MLSSSILVVGGGDGKSAKSNEKQQSVRPEFTCRSQLRLTNFLGDLLGSSVPHSEFISTVFQNRPLVVRGNMERFSDLVETSLFGLDVLALLENTASENGIHVWLRSAEMGGTLDSIQVEPSAALKLYAAGHSLYCRAPPALEKRVIPTLLQELGMGPSNAPNDRFRRGEIETFFSRKGHTTEWHTDFQENFTLQLSGTKKWSFTSSSAVSPLRGCTPHFGGKQSPDVVETQMRVLRLGDAQFRADQFAKDVKEGTVTTVTLQPGDFLYHPAGVWHRVECLEDSVSINVSLVASNLAEICAGAVQQLLWRAEQGRYRKILNTLDSAAALREAESVLKTLKEEINKLQPSDLVPISCLRPNDDGDEGEGEGEGEDDEEDDDGNDEGDEGETEERVICADALDDSSADFLAFASHTRYRLNPLASIISASDLSIAGWRPRENINDERDKDFTLVVHVGFGNAEFESLSRVVVKVDGCVSTSETRHILNKLAELRDFSLDEVFLQGDTGAKRKRGCGSSNKQAVLKILYCLHLAGALSPIF